MKSDVRIFESTIAKLAKIKNLPVSIGMNPVQIIDRIWIGSWQSATDPRSVLRHNFGLIVNVTAHVDSPFKDSIATYRIPIIRYFDSETVLLNHIPEVSRVINETLRRYPKKNVLIHCEKGTCRGPTVAAGYLMTTYGMSARDAVQYIRSKIPDSFPPDSPFLSTLVKMEEKKV